MLKQGFAIFWALFKFVGVLLIPVGIAIAIFAVLCFVWFLIFKYHHKMEFKPSNVRVLKKRPLLKQLFVDLPRRYVMDIYERDPDFFRPPGHPYVLRRTGMRKDHSCRGNDAPLSEDVPESQNADQFWSDNGK